MPEDEKPSSSDENPVCGHFENVERNPSMSTRGVTFKVIVTKNSL